jgi:hypothetical protein
LAGYEIGAQWNGSTWASWPTTGLWINPNVTLNINRAWRAGVHEGKLYAAGSFYHPNISGTGDRRLIAEFDGSSWSRMGGGYGPDITASDRIESLTSHQGSLYVGGLFSVIRHGEQFLGSTTPSANIARYSGGAWSALPNGGLNGRVYCMAEFDGDLYVGGDFTATADSSLSLLRIARLRNGVWERVGGGMAIARPRSMIVADDGRGRALFIGATAGDANNTFPVTSDTTPVSGIVRWNGTRYTELASGITGGIAIYAMARYDHGTGEALFVGADSLRDPANPSVFGRTARWGPAPMVDSDGDGIFDIWETSGIDCDCDGSVDLPLHTMGADPQIKDIFLEIDSMPGRAPSDDALNDVIAAFANSNVLNPGGTGVRLHITNDTTDVLTFQDFPNEMADLHIVKRSHFGTVANRGALNARAILDAKARVFRYCIFGNHYGTTLSAGMAELPGDDFMVTLGAPTGNVLLDRRYQSSTLMHEMGHTLGLYHGGTQIDWNDDRRYNNKPNYRSIMNYQWIFAFDRAGWVLDYSKYAASSLHESALIESQGVGAIYDAVMLYGAHPPAFGFMNGPVDWNRNGVIDLSPVAADINPIESGLSSPGDFLLAAEDWSRLQYNFRNSPNYGAGVSLITTGDMDEHMTSDLHDATSPCIADIDDGSGSGLPDGGVGIEDLLYYLAVYDAGDARADVDDGSATGTPDGGVGIEDLLYYLQRFDAGC